MNNKEKIQLADLVINFIQNRTEDKALVPKLIGYLNKAQGWNGFKEAKIGTPVFDTGDRYMIMIESLDGKINVPIPYYKETLSKLIDFIPET